MSFQSLKLIPPILQALQREGYTEPTPIQEQAIPPLLAGRDLIGCAQTGTGKTAAFALPILQLLAGDRQAATGAARPIRGLILTPTRELAIQIDESLAAYGRNLRIKHLVVFGGVSQHPQTQALGQGVDILVATPGRLLDLVKQGFVRLRDIEYFVLDEADRMLDMGFLPDVRRVIAQLPVKRQTLLFSATMPEEITKLANSLLRSPIRVEVTPVSSTVEAIEQAVYFVDKPNKKDLLVQLLQDETVVSALVFTRTKYGADKLTKQLVKAGIQAQAIHGNKSQGARQNALGNFKSRQTRVLVATDIAARGIDVEELSHVINFELPNVPETYVHRIGRTGRAGLGGVALSFCDQEERAYLKDIERLIGKAIPVIAEHAFPPGTGAASTPAEAQLQPVRTPLARIQDARARDPLAEAQRILAYAPPAIQRATGSASSRHAETPPEPKQVTSGAVLEDGGSNNPRRRRSRRRRGKGQAAVVTPEQPQEQNI